MTSQRAPVLRSSRCSLPLGTYTLCGPFCYVLRGPGYPLPRCPLMSYVLSYARGQWTLLEVLLSEGLCRRGCLTSMLTKVTCMLGIPFSLKCPFGNVCGLHLGASGLFPLFPSLPHTTCYPRACLRDSRSFSYHLSNTSFQTHPGAQLKQGDSVNNNGLLLERPCRFERV